jgi:hypothetical protein
MTRQELNLAIYEGTTDKVLWQPRLETWIGDRMRWNTMPDRFKGMSNFDIYDELRCSIRYAASAGIVHERSRDDVVTTEEQHPDHSVSTVRTPSGEIRTVHRDLWHEGQRVNHRITEYPVTTVADLRVAIDLVERQHFSANVETFERAAATMGHRGEPTMFLSSSGFTELIKNWCGLENAYYLLYDHRAEVEEYLEACDRRDDRLIDAALQLPCRVYNLGDHATNEFTPPPILERYLMPRWQRISDRLHAAGRYVHSHWDGNSKTMLPYLKDTRLDAVESLTPFPQCDMTLEEIQDATGDMVVLDLIPALFFLPSYPLQDLLDFTRRVIDMFAPRLILGISDEISQVGEIERVEAITELVDEVCGLAA